MNKTLLGCIAVVLGAAALALTALAHAAGSEAALRIPLVVGLTTIYGLWQRQDAIVLPIVGLLVHLFVVYREEPRTRERLGLAYDTYRATVPRWVPRF